MTVRLCYVAVATFVLSAVACAVALKQMDSIPALILIAPGYAVQAWLFETGRALGGIGYQATIIGVSALFWAIMAVAGGLAVRHLIHRTGRRRAA